MTTLSLDQRALLEARAESAEAEVKRLRQANRHAQDAALRIWQCAEAAKASA